MAFIGRMAMALAAMSKARLAKRYSGVGSARLTLRIGTEKLLMCRAPCMMTSPTCGAK